MAKLLNTALFLAFVGFLGPHPAPAVSRLYQPGKVYQYNYETAVQLNEVPSSGRDIGYKIAALVRVSTVWQSASDPNDKLMKIELSHAQLQVHSVHTQDHHLQAHASMLDKHSKLPAFLHWHDGKAVKIYLPDIASDASANLKKGLASLFQVEISTAASGSVSVENDVSGSCSVTYKKGKTGLLEKVKTNCKLSGQPDPSHFRHPNDIQSVNSSSNVFYNYEFHQDMAIKNVDVRETVYLYVNIWSKAAIAANAVSQLKFVEEKTGGTVVGGSTLEQAIATLGKQEKTKYVAQSLTATYEPRNACSDGQCSSLAKVIEDYKERMKSENLAKVKSANAFLRVLERMRVAGKEEILAVLKDKKNKDVLSQLLDAAAAAQTEAAVSAAFAVVNFNGKDLNVPERFLLCLAIASHPNQFIINEILRVLEKPSKNEKIKSTLVITLGAVSRTHCQILGSELCDKSTTIKNVESYLLKNTEKCKTEECKLIYLRGLENFGSVNTISSLIEFAKKGGKAGLAAIRAILKIGPHNLDDKDLKCLAAIYHQLRKPYDSTVRLLAIEAVFRSGSANLTNYIGDFIYSSANQLTPEVASFALSKLRELAEEDANIAKALHEIGSNPTIWNYYNLAQNGDSTAFSRLLAKTVSMDSTFGLNMETVGNGVTKRSSFDVHLKKDKSQVHVLSVGLFAEGISSFGGGGDDNTEEETSAGMELVIMGVKLRPYTFFTGTGELMSHVWSGTASDPTPAFQGNILMLDHYQQMALHNGLVADLNLQGAISVDLSGSIQVSLWNRNSHSLVKASGALLMHGAIHIDTSFAKSHVEFAMGGDSLVDFITDLDFYSKPFKSCFQMEQPAFSFRYNVRKAESVPGSKHLVKTLRKRTVHLQGKSFAMHRKNFIQCANLLVQN